MLDSFSLLTLSLLVLLGVLTIWFVGPGYNTYSAAHSPTILTSLGIFGTFLGVALGLLEFDTKDIQTSVPDLIEGLKTAFWTSIAGLLGALLVKFRHLKALLHQYQAQVKAPLPAVTLTDVANVLVDIRDSLSDSSASGLCGVIVALRHEQAQAFKSLYGLLEDYQSRMATANATALVSALDTVMRDFNTEINTQYGDNFKELNQAVGQMLSWQQAYKAELTDLLERQRINGDLLDKASHAYETVVTHSEVFQQVSSSLGEMMAVLQSQSAELHSYLSQLALVAEKAASGLPMLDQRIEHLTDTLAESMLGSQQQLNATLNASAEALQQTSLAINERLALALEKAQKGLHTQIEQMVSRTEQQVMRLDDALEGELTKALTTFGYQLTALSEKFVSDYLPLTEKLREVLALAQVQRERPATTKIATS